MKSYLTLLESFQLLTEDRIDFLKQQYKDKLPTDHDELAKHKDSDKIVDHFASKADPSTNKAHTQWILGQYAKKNIRQEDAPQIKSTLNDFALVKDNLEKRDVNQYKDIGELRDAIATQKAATEKRIKAKKTEATEKSATMEKLYDEGGVTGFKIPNRAVSIKNYGPGGKVAETNWCTAANSENNMFNHYKGGKYTMHFPNGEVLQFHHQSNQLKDKFDREIQPGDPRFAEHEHHIANFINQTEKDEPGSMLIDRFKHYEPEEIEKHLSKHEADVNNILTTREPERVDDALDNLKYNDSHKHLSKIAEKAKLSDDQFNRINSIPTHQDYWGKQGGVALQLSKNPHLTHEQVGKLLHGSSLLDRGVHEENLYRNPAVKGEHLDTLVHEARTTSHFASLAKNPHLQSHHIDKLIQGNDIAALVKLAANNNITLSHEHQKTIAANGSHGVEFAQRSDLHPDIVNHLVHNGNEWLHDALINNPHVTLSHEQLKSIYDSYQPKQGHSSHVMGGTIFKSPKATPELREHIFNTELGHLSNRPATSNPAMYHIVRSKAFTKEHLDRMLDAAEKADVKPSQTNYISSYASRAPKASSEQISRQISNFTSGDNNIGPLLEKKNLKPAHLVAIHDFMADPKNQVLSYYKNRLLEHPSVDSSVLHSVFDKGDNWDKTNVLHHDAVQASHFQKALDHGQGLHAAISSSPSAPPSTLAKLADSPISFIRQNIASHKNTDQATLKKLADDSNEEIAATAKKRLKIK